MNVFKLDSLAIKNVTVVDVKTYIQNIKYNFSSILPNKENKDKKDMFYKRYFNLNNIF